MTQTLDGNPIPASVNSSARIGGTQDAADATFTPDLLNAYPRAMSTITGLVAALAAKVEKTGSETITGIKNFATGILVPDESIPVASIAGLEYALSSRATLVAAPGGTDDTVITTTARDAAGAGGTMVFGPGTYVVTGLLANVANQHWVIPPGTTVKTKNGSNTPTIDVTANGVTIDGGGTIDGNRTNQTSTTIGYSGLGTTACVRIISRSNVTVSNLTMVDGGSNGVFIDASTNVTIDGNRVSGSAPTGNSKQIMVIDVVGSSSNIHIRNNTIDAVSRTNGCIVALCQASGRYIRQLHITDNTCLVGNAGAADTLAIELFSDVDASIYDATVKGNVVVGPSGVVSTDKVFGISCGGNTNGASEGNAQIAITGNTVRNCPALCYEAVGSGIAITGNTAINSGPIAVLAVTTTGGVRSVSVTGNTLIDVIDVSYSIRIEGGTDGIYGLVVSGNTVRNNAGGYVLYLLGVISGASITGNTFTDCNGPGVGILGAMTDSIISNNVIDLTGVGGSTADGILLASASAARLAVNGNIIKGAARMGVYVNAAVDHLSLVGNRVTGCDYGIFAATATNLAIASNVMHGNATANYNTSGSTFSTHVINGAGG